LAIYEKVKKACSEKGISVLALEEQLGFPRSSICKWDKNIPAVNRVKAVAEILDKPMEYFLEE
jgi:transcriptional regulator with XRE-family HTH domain